MKTSLILGDPAVTYIPNPKNETIMTKLLNRIAAAFRNWKAGRKEAQEEARTQSLCDRFNITVKGGSMFLTVDGVAFQHIPEGQTAADTIETLREAQRSAIALDVYKR